MPQSAATIEVLTHLVGVPKSARLIRYRQLGDGTWVSDAVVAARHGEAGSTIYPCALRFAAHEEMAGPLLAGPEALDRFRGRSAELLGWAHRPEIGFSGTLTPDAAAANCDPDLVSDPPGGDLEVAPMYASDQPVPRDHLFRPGPPDEPLLAMGPNYFYYGFGSDQASGRPLERGADGSERPIPGIRAVWVIQRIEPRTEAAAHELAGFASEITDLVLSHEEPLPEPDAITGGSRLTPRAPRRIPHVRLSASRIAEGFWRIGEFDYRRWQGTVGREQLDAHALVDLLTGARAPAGLQRAASEMAARVDVEDEPLDAEQIYKRIGLSMEVASRGDGESYDITLTRADGREMTVRGLRLYDFEGELSRPASPTLERVVDEVCDPHNMSGYLRRAKKFFGDEYEQLLGW